ncbi:Murein DD-endopeptidase MepH [Polaromonas vacuolata]|uniref:Murein DD-endopeptidase MepH n=1 Tax=Polaromonas vacuolata TaxID=37448 RepID=A0A6H2HAA6_9BURK|nr:C40 family peptidase [Polaromonas vacuolata]QJC56733.1 Murein DD-endopeptidase MepH [Polaromonas vacuolata]
MPKKVTAILLTALLLSTSVYALPVVASEEYDKAANDKGLLTQISQVGQNVGKQATQLVANAIDLLGVPYRRGGNSAETGFDCSGFVRAIYEQSIGLILPRRAEQQAAATQNIEKSDLQPGDLVFFNTMRRAFSHVGIYIGDGKFIHAPRPGAEVRVESMSIAYWRGRFDGARRVLSESLDDGATNSADKSDRPEKPALAASALAALKAYRLQLQAQMPQATPASIHLKN